MMIAEAEAVPRRRGWLINILLLLGSVVLLTAALAPIYQFYLAWVGLVPWLLVVRRTRSNRSAFLWSWLGGFLFFMANMWWLWGVTKPGMFVLIAYLGLFLGFAAVIFRGCGLITSAKPQAAALLMGIVWIALEWVRGNWSMFGNTGLPWLYLGTTQSKFLLMCQIADIGGVYAVSFWVALINFAVFFTLIERRVNLHLLAHVALALLILGLYGAYRMKSEPVRPGPVVLVIQPNYPQSNTGEKGAPIDQIVKFHLQTTRVALEDCRKRGLKVDLIVWSETMMSYLNPQARVALQHLEYGSFLRKTYDQIASLANESDSAILAGGMFADGWHVEGDSLVASDRRNSAYLFERSGLLSEKRYDKIHLVPFGEFIPYDSIPPIHSLLMKLGPSGYENYVLTPGNENEMAVFDVNGTRFVVPICFEDLVGPLVADMIRVPGGTKRADLIVNITNDGWFMWSEMPQHLQAAVFRSIENRVPTARSVNTGISGFIDSLGRVHDTVQANTEGWSVAELKLDPRVTFYTKHGDLFVEICAGISALLIAVSILRSKATRGKPA